MSSYSSANDEYDSDEPPPLELDLRKLKDHATEIFHARCTTVKRLTRGSWHEIYVLKFEAANTIQHESLVQADFSCIARFARITGARAKEESEIATIRYIKQHTSIPVPEIYYQDLNPKNGVGAAYVLMERLPGRHLYKSWDDMSLDHKRVALSEIASVIAQLTSLEFDQIGCLTQNGLGPIINPCFETSRGPFSSTLEYLQSFVSTTSITSSPQLGDLLGQIRVELAKRLQDQNTTDSLKPPFCMIHADFDAQNMLFLDAPDGTGPKLSGLIDFEYAYTGPIYFLYEYPIFIQDVSWSKHLYAENATLRAHFIDQILSRLPDATSREKFISCINSKSFFINGFRDAFMMMKCSEDTLINSATYYLKSIKEGTALAYSGRLDYKPEYYSLEGNPLETASVDKPAESIVTSTG